MVLQGVFIFDAVIFVWFGSFANMSWLLTLFLPGFVCIFASCFLLDLCFSLHLFCPMWFCLFLVLSYFITTVFRCPFVSYERNQEGMWIWVGEGGGMMWEELGEGEP